MLSVNQNPNELTLAVTGDSLITRRISGVQDKSFLRVLEIIQGADIAFTNLETTLHDFGGYPAAESGGAWMASPPYIADELRRLGFHLASCANNHVMDWGVDGMLATMEFLDQAGLTYAGVGRDLVQARQPVYRDTPQGRVALISTTSTFPSWGRAGNSWQDVQGRPGLNPLRHEWTCYISKFVFMMLIRLARELSLGLPTDVLARQEMHLFGIRFAVADSSRIETSVYQPDLEGNLQSVREASKRADWVMVSLHSHEADQSVDSPARFAVTFAKACIDQGADIVVMHGAHVLRGLEIYKGRPIFYGLGNFIYQSRCLKKLPADVYERYGLNQGTTPTEAFKHMESIQMTSAQAGQEDWSPHITGSTFSALAKINFNCKSLDGIELYPIVLSSHQDRQESGYPALATGLVAGKIIQNLSNLSESFGTTIIHDDGVGLVNLKSMIK